MLLASLAACFFKPPRPDGDAKQPGDGPGAEAWLDGYNFRKHVTVTSGITGPLVNFPVGVSVMDGDLNDHASNQGRDILATTSDGETLLATELAAFDSGALELWVQLPELADTGAFYLYYGGADVPPSTTVWDGPVFAGVWHLSDMGTARDSTSQGNHMSAGGSDLPDSFADGVFGPARQLDGNDRLDGGDPNNGSLDFGSQSFSYSLWVHQSQLLPGGFDTPFYKGGPSNSEPGYCWLLGSANWTAKVTDSATNFADPELGVAATFQNRWVHIAAVVDRQADSMTVFADGVLKDTQTLSTRNLGSLSTAQPIQVGRGGMEPFAGRLDEVRVYKTAVTSEWLAAEHNNGSLATFLTFGPEENKP